jgi:integrase
METINFTNTRLGKLENFTGKYTRYKDSGKKGLILRITPGGKKVFRLRIWNGKKKREDRLTLGEYPEMTIKTARELIDKHQADIAHGVDAVEKVKREREEQTLNEIFDIWLETHAKVNLKRWNEEERRYILYIKPHFGKKQLSEITPDHLRRWKARLLQQPKQNGNGTLTPSLVGRALTTFSSIFSKAASQVANPCSQVEKHKPQKRTVFLKPGQLEKFFSALDHAATPEILRDYLLLSLYTGARQANVLAMRWTDIDTTLKLWIIPGGEMKNDEDMVVPLLDQAIKILERRKTNRRSIFVLPSPRKSKTGHFVEPKKAWKLLLERAGLPLGFRLHDLRRTMGSWQAITGSSTKIIGASLGHKSEQATAHYAHLIVDPVRASMQRAADEMDRQGQDKKVVELKKG